MKTRTRIASVIFAVLAGLSTQSDWRLFIAKMLGHAPTMGWGIRDQIVVVLQGCIICSLLAVAWISLLMRKRWAWGVLIGLLMANGAIKILDIFITPNPPSGYAVLVLASLLIDIALPLLLLMTDKPSGWERPQSSFAEALADESEMR